MGQSVNRELSGSEFQPAGNRKALLRDGFKVSTRKNVPKLKTKMFQLFTCTKPRKFSPKHRKSFTQQLQQLCFISRKENIETTNNKQ